MEIIRQDYLDLLLASKDKNDTAKVLVGMRRTGKSTIMCQYLEVLKKMSIPEEMIFYINLDEIGAIMTAEDLKDMMSPVLQKKGQHYILIDEIQDVDGWERVVAMLIAMKDCDIYITGSNAKMLSSELSTKLSGRYMEIEILPFSFREFLEMNPGDKYERFEQYLIFGSLPIVDIQRDIRINDIIVGSAYDTVMMKDVLTHINGDATKLDAICRFLYSNVGNITNTDNISKETLIANGTVNRYVDALESAYLFYHAEKYDVVGKKILKTNGKYYATDLGMRRVVLKGINSDDISKPIENIVFMELKRRGYTVRIGSYRDKEIDFTAMTPYEVRYYQVTETMLAEETKKRELSPLESVRDNHSKTILTLDRIGLGNHNGIRIMNLIDWLLGKPE